MSDSPHTETRCGAKQHYFGCDLRVGHDGAHEAHDTRGKLLHHWGERLHAPSANALVTLREAIEGVLAEPHHWCTDGQVVDRQFTKDGSGRLGCNCPKRARDERLRILLAQADRLAGAAPSAREPHEPTDAEIERAADVLRDELQPLLGTTPFGDPDYFAVLARAVFLQDTEQQA